MGFVKLDCGIVRSTLWFDPPARDVFITALLLAAPREFVDPVEELAFDSLEPTGWVAPSGWYGFVDSSAPGLIHTAQVDAEKGNAALARLAAPEKVSKSKNFEGRRMIRVDGGYVILNYIKHRERDHTSPTRSKNWRDRRKAKEAAATATRRDVTPEHRNDTQADEDADADEKSRGGDPERAREPVRIDPAGLTPMRPARRVPRLGSVSVAFLRCFDRYVNPYRKQEASQTFQELAEETPGGEVALADEICAAFDGGLLKRHPYDGEARFRPKFETFLAERMWLDKAAPSAGPEYPKL